ncbi:hypothetical protein CYMTET_41480 [Cymbomonas tetramitiformis]|uniref:Rho termination factor-like N-terminal domain-containing protein n=1 Tax=Cymbomonas tetramitiformis TaxID=36881 RepID=A0AAE0F278_9CHLO|nr:hypothetical protein CYMTET_41480 [Cymbomonas tetramitiformis]
MKRAGVEPNVITYSSLISACEKGGQWEKALEVFAGMKKAGVEPNVITYSSLISACEKGEQWEKLTRRCFFSMKAEVEAQRDHPLTIDACEEGRAVGEGGVHVLQSAVHPYGKMTPNAHTPDVEASVGPAMSHQTAELEKLLVADLRCLAKQLGCKGYSKLRKSALVTLILLETADNPIALP